MTAIIMRGDARDLPLPDESVDLIVTSPPYFGLRSYTDGGEHYAEQIGSEATPKEYVAALLECTREWVRVLKPGGSLFVNLGDKYSTYTGANWGNGRSLDGFRGTAKVPHGGPVNAPKVYGIPYKSLMGLPWRYALGCIDDLGLTLRAEIVWAKTNGMPESATDRVRRAHEQVFHFTREPRYYAAVDAIREPVGDYERHGSYERPTPTGQRPRAMSDACNPLGRLPGSVWEIATQPLTVPAELGLDHFAAFPMELPRRLILGWSPPGVCTECGDGRRPLAERVTRQRHNNGHHGPTGLAPDNTHGKYATTLDIVPDFRITGYACACPEPTAPTRPARVLDPFGGTGTTALVADVLGRTGISVDRSADYCGLATWRTTDPGERARAMQVPKPPPVPDGQGDLFEALAAS